MGQFCTLFREFLPERENNDVTSGHNFHLTGLLLGKHTWLHKKYAKRVFKPICTTYIQHENVEDLSVNY